jgi:hypothetical protein
MDAGPAIALSIGVAIIFAMMIGTLAVGVIAAIREGQF